MIPCASDVAFRAVMEWTRHGVLAFACKQGIESRGRERVCIDGVELGHVEEREGLT